MSGLNQRRQSDLNRLQQLCRQSGGALQITDDAAGSGRIIAFQLNLPTAGSTRYPAQVQAVSRFQIELPARYPFDAPTARMRDTPIHHPNVFESGVICVGSKWNPSEGLDIYVTRLCQLLTFDPLLVNMHSIAHSAAGHWYSRALKRHADAFPTATIQWDKPQEKVLRTCPGCQANLRLPTGRTGRVECPRCQTEFDAQT
jgi:ubiquitin-protein ligase